MIQKKNMTIYCHIKNKLSQKIFYQLGPKFKTYNDFLEFQQSAILSLPKKDINNLIHLIEIINRFNPRHIDADRTTDHLIINGFYFEANGKLMTYSTYD